MIMNEMEMTVISLNSRTDNDTIEGRLVLRRPTVSSMIVEKNPPAALVFSGAVVVVDGGGVAGGGEGVAGIVARLESGADILDVAASGARETIGGTTGGAASIGRARPNARTRRIAKPRTRSFMGWGLEPAPRML